MKRRSRPYIDLTGHLGSLKSSLTPDSKQFEPTPALWQLARRPAASEPSQVIWTLFWSWLLTTLAGSLLLHFWL